MAIIFRILWLSNSEYQLPIKFYGYHVQNLLESNPLKPKLLVGGLGVCNCILEEENGMWKYANNINKNSLNKPEYRNIEISLIRIA